MLFITEVLIYYDAGRHETETKRQSESNQIC